MSKMKNYFLSFSKTIKDNSLYIISALILANLFFRFGIGMLLAIGLIGFAVYTVYNYFIKE